MFFNHSSKSLKPRYAIRHIEGVVSPLMPLMACLLFFVLGYLGGTIMVGGTMTSSLLAIYSNYGFAMLSLLFTTLACALWSADGKRGVMVLPLLSPDWLTAHETRHLQECS